MRKIEAKQTLLRGQLEGQSAANQGSDPTTSDYSNLDAKLSQLLRDLLDAETRLQNLELGSQRLEANNVMLTSLVVSLQAQNQMLTDQLGAALAIVQDVKHGMSTQVSGKGVDLTGNFHSSSEALSLFVDFLF
jgi:hypothetical protein